MKTQALSRNQSLDNVPISAALQSKKYQKQQNNKLITQSIISLSQQNIKSNPYLSAKIIGQSSNKGSRKFLLNTSKYGSNKNIKPVGDKKDRYNSLHFGLQTLKKSQQNKRQLINKNNLYKFNHGEIRSFHTIQDDKIKGMDLGKQCKTFNIISAKKGTYHIIKNAKQFLDKGQIQPDNKIKTIKLQQYCKQEKSFQKPGKFLLNTTTVVKDCKLTPYINLIHKKRDKGPSQSLYQLENSRTLAHESEVTIQLIEQKIENDQNKEMSGEFSCSEIKQKQVEGDSDFLENSHKQLLECIDEMGKKQQVKRKIWRKLPNDFLKP